MILVAVLAVALRAAPSPTNVGAGEVALRTIDAGAVRVLRANDTARLRLISLWATWCAPCVVELPDVVAIDRAYRGLRFETITLSLDEADRHEAALDVLRRAGAAGANYRFTGEMPALAATVDPSWTGALPFTLLMAPGGEVLMRCEGTLEIDRLRRTIEQHLPPPATPRARP